MQIVLSLPREADTSGAYKKKYCAQIVLRDICVGYKNTVKIVKKKKIVRNDKEKRARDETCRE